MKSITVAEALRRAGITKVNLLQMEREWKARFGADLPIPVNHLGHRQLDEHWIIWLRDAWQLRKRGASWLEIRHELAPIQPGRSPQRTPVSAAAFVYEL